MSESEVLERLDLKSRDGQFLWELQDGFELSPRESLLILETARLYYSQSPEPGSGRVSLWVLAKDAGVGKPLDELSKIQIWVTLDGGHEDIDAYHAEICRRLRHSAKSVKRYVNIRLVVWLPCTSVGFGIKKADERAHYSTASVNGWFWSIWGYFVAEQKLLRC